MYRKVLVPIDGSKPADKALDHATDLVKSISVSSKTELTILYVIPDLPVPLGFEKPMRSFKTGKVISFSDFIKEMHESMRLGGEKMLSERKKKYESNNNNVTIRAEVIVGHGLSISNTIIEFADKEKIDLIVIGNIGLSGISKVKALGSVSRAIAERSVCPVLVVHF
jgi:nucleotide-binding universal stress UspA family protein